jgi:hypothetical protein
VEDDAAALLAIHRVMLPDGRLVITVPAGQFLWSEHDVTNVHFRRYGRRQLAERLAQAGFRIRFLSYYNSALFLPIAGMRLLHRLRPGGAGHDIRMPWRPVNTLLHQVFAAERFVLGPMRLPFGVSLIGIAQKDGGAASRPDTDRRH